MRRLIILKTEIRTIDEYISQFSSDVKKILTEIREIVKTVAPEAEEAIRYGMPTFRLNNRNLFHFAAFNKHIGVYPTPPIIEAMKDELKIYKTSKGAIQFPLSEEMPFQLIKEIVKECVKQFNASKSYK